MSGIGPVRIEVWSDIVCPFCYIGKRRLENALSQFGHADDIEVEWRSFELHPAHPRGHRENVYETVAKKTGGSLSQARAMTRQVEALGAREDLSYDFDRAVMVNTFDAHRLAHLARAHGAGAEMHERLLRAHLVEGQLVDDRTTLVRLAAEVGLPREEAARVLAGDDYARDVTREGEEARRLGAKGVPFFVFNREYGAEGAQSVEALLSILHRARESVG